MTVIRFPTERRHDATRCQSCGRTELDRRQWAGVLLCDECSEAMMGEQSALRVLERVAAGAARPPLARRRD